MKTIHNPRYHHSQTLRNLNDLQLRRRIPLLQPLLHILRIPLYPRGLRLDTIETLCQRTIETNQLLTLEELPDLSGLLTGGEVAHTHGHNCAKHVEAGRELLDEGVIVGLEPLPELEGTLAVGTEAGDGLVDILVLDFTIESQLEGLLDVGRVLGTAEPAEGNVLLVIVAAIAVHIEDVFILCSVSKIPDVEM